MLIRERDIYDDVLDTLGSFYGGITNRVTMDRAVRETITPEDCALWLLFPAHDEGPVFGKTRRAAAEAQGLDFDACFRHLIETSFLLQWDEVDGVPRYVRSYLFKMTMAHGLEYDSSLLALALADWFNTLRDGGADNIPIPNPEYRVIPAEGLLRGNETTLSLGVEIPDEREVVPYDLVSEMVKKARIITVINCFCRTSKEQMHTRECDYPLETCIIFDKLAEDTLKWGEGRIITPEEALEIVRKCREMGLVTQISNSKNPLILCNCCSCCCGIIGGYFRGKHVVGKPSRYVIRHHAERCEACGKCAETCPFHVPRLQDGKMTFNTDMCVGCGLCAERCRTGSLSLSLREDADKYLPDRERMDIMFV